MTATLHDFFAHPRAPARLVGTAIVVPIHDGRSEVATAHMRALDTLRDLYYSATRGCASALMQIEMISGSHGNPQVARLARTLLDNLRNPPLAPELVSAPCDCESGGVA